MSDIRPKLKIADQFLDVRNRQMIEINDNAVPEHTRKSVDFRCLKTLDTNMILNHLDEQIKLRETPVDTSEIHKSRYELSEFLTVLKNRHPLRRQR